MGVGARRVLIFGEQLRLRGIWRVVRCAGHSVDWVEDPALLVQHARRTLPEIVIFDAAHGGPATQLLARDLHQALPTTTLVMLATPPPPQAARALLEAPWFRHLIPLDAPDRMARVAATLARLTGHCPFGLGWHFPPGTHIETVPIEGSDRQPAHDAIERYMARLGIRGRFSRHVQTIADEMLMNAIYDAPVDRGTHESLHAHRPRTEKIRLVAADQPTFKIASDGRHFGVAVRDPFGTLDVDTLKRYIAKGLRQGDDQLDQKVGGAGLGLYLLFDHCSRLTVNIQPRVRTEFVGLINIEGSFRDHLLAPKSFEIFIDDNG